MRGIRAKVIFGSMVACLCEMPTISEANVSCVSYENSRFAEATIGEVVALFDDTQLGVDAKSEILLSQSGPFYANPISQPLIAIDYVEGGTPALALGHIDLSTYLANRYRLCEAELLYEMAWMVRIEALRSVLSKPEEQSRYYGLTGALILPKLQLSSSQYSELLTCVEEWKVSGAAIGQVAPCG